MVCLFSHKYGNCIDAPASASGSGRHWYNALQGTSEPYTKTRFNRTPALLWIIRLKPCAAYAVCSSHALVVRFSCSCELSRMRRPCVPSVSLSESAVDPARDRPRWTVGNHQNPCWWASRAHRRWHVHSAKSRMIKFKKPGHASQKIAYEGIRASTVCNCPTDFRVEEPAGARKKPCQKGKR